MDKKEILKRMIKILDTDDWSIHELTMFVELLLELQDDVKNDKTDNL